ncbi:hypothetical protein MHW47_00060 [Streptomyces sp. OfavH-34-F]|uniref:hypothetical protein n=1 Tax=Streptomyces sp. OfavH-34-F TaxID=2917760 RepID=UPI001EF3A284|nr:hypothetical protein [Streptomyces sp. OfavH-34-F]MCG7522848.1 hypothetical protein [Streptomyces sp. OfavH-34-F]
MSSGPSSSDTTPEGPGSGRSAVLDAGRKAAAVRRRSDSERCRRRVLDVITGMRRARTPLSDAEITRRAEVNPQYLQRHRDLKAEAEAVRAHLADDRPRAVSAAAARQEAALTVENRMLLEQNATLRRDSTSLAPSSGPCACGILRPVRGASTSQPWTRTPRSRNCAGSGTRLWQPSGAGRRTCCHFATSFNA